MTNIDIYNQIISETLGIPITNPDHLSRKTCETWDSLNHMKIIFELEKSFNCCLSREDILGFVTYQDGIKILQAKGLKI
jgi:acyl carrier protein